MNTTKEVKEFCERVGITPAQFTGEDPIKGPLEIEGDFIIPPNFTPRVTSCMILRYVTAISPGFAPQVGGFLELYGISHIPAAFTPIVGGCLYLNSVTTIGDGFAPIVGRPLWLNNVTTIGDGFAPIVGGFLDLNSVLTIGDGFAPVVEGPLWLNSVTAIGDGFAPVVGATLELNRVTTIGRDFAPIVGESLSLAWATSLAPGFAPIVAGDLLLDSAHALPADFTPTLGGFLYLRVGVTAKAKKLDATKPIEAQGGKYIIADGLLTEVVSKRGNVWRMRRIGRDKISFLVTDGSGKFAHGDTLKEARESLMYKISGRDMSEYEKLSEDSELTFAAAIEMYRTITGACAAGIRHFVESNNLKKKNYTLREIINLTKGQYGHEQLVKFFRD